MATAIAEKECGVCRELKPLEDFNRHRREPDGRQTRCRPCQRAGVKRWRQKNLEKAGAKAQRERDNEGNQEKLKARQTVRNAVRRGRMQKPDRCEGCGEPTPDRQLHGHHQDYSKPLEVEWLCPECHSAKHVESEVSCG